MRINKQWKNKNEFIWKLLDNYSLRRIIPFRKLLLDTLNTREKYIYRILYNFTFKFYSLYFQAYIKKVYSQKLFLISLKCIHALSHAILFRLTRKRNWQSATRCKLVKFRIWNVFHVRRIHNTFDIKRLHSFSLLLLSLRLSVKRILLLPLFSPPPPVWKLPDERKTRFASYINRQPGEIKLDRPRLIGLRFRLSREIQS